MEGSTESNNTMLVPAIFFVVSILIIVVISAILFQKFNDLKRFCENKIRDLVAQINDVNRDEYDILKLHETKLRVQNQQLNDIDDNLVR